MKQVEGLWSKNDLRRAFVNGAKWWEFQQHGATMWNSDIDQAEKAAEKKYSAAQHRLHLTAFGVGLLAFFAGFGICYLWLVCQFGGR